MQSTGQAWSWSLVSDLFCFFIATNGQRCHYCNSCIKWDLEAIFLKEDDKFHGFSVSWKPSDIMQKLCIFSHHSRWNHTTKYKILRPLTMKEVKHKTKNHNGSEHWAHESCQWTEFSVPKQFHNFLLYSWHPSNNRGSSWREGANCNCGQFNKH